ncbi:MAG: 50S ribosomal protein L35 [Candidatus Margulisbacteria bacterium]|jgi:large subunit ribosomal protein L35|nr:50S ribosomal protein L35 [Candidatus Margulisiibacteriota bacterium]
MKKFKQKTNSSAKKRFKITGTGKIMRRKIGMRHLLSHRSARTKICKRGDFEISSSDKQKLKILMPGI